MKRWRLHWLDGTIEDVFGLSISDALHRAGHDVTGLLVAALDFYTTRADYARDELQSMKEHHDAVYWRHEGDAT